MGEDATRGGRWRPWVENALGLGILAAIAWVLWDQRSRLSELLDASWGDLAVMGVLVLGAWLVNGAQTWLLYRAEGARIGFWENIAVAAGANLANYLPMRVGTVLRGRYMKQVHGLRYARFGSVFGIRTVLLVSASGILGCAATLGLWAKEDRLAPLLLGAFAAMALGAAVALTFGLPKLPGHGAASRVWNDFADGFAMARARPSVSLQVLVLVLAQQALLGVRLFIGFDAFQTQVSVWFLLLLAPLVILVSFVGFTPGALGLREAAIGYVAYATGYDFNLGLFAGSLDRAVLLAVTVLLGFPSLAYMWRRQGTFRAD